MSDRKVNMFLLPVLPERVAAMWLVYCPEMPGDRGTRDISLWPYRKLVLLSCRKDTSDGFRLYQGFSEVGTDESCPAGDQYLSH